MISNTLLATGFCAVLVAFAALTVEPADEFDTQAGANAIGDVAIAQLDSAARSDFSPTPAPAEENDVYSGMSSAALDVRLVGTMVNEPQEYSLALIACEGNPSGTNFRVGDELPDGSRLVAVFETEAHLELAGATRIIYVEGLADDRDLRPRTRTARSSTGYQGTYEDALFNDQLADD